MPVDPIRPLSALPPAGANRDRPASRIERILAYRRLLALALAVFVLDQLTKIWIAALLPFGTYGEPGAIPVIRGFFYLVHVGNTGAAWSLFSGQSVLLAALAVT